MNLEELGRDTNGGISSQPTIFSGKNRGTRKPEVGGNWLCTGGYTTDSLWCEKNAHGSLSSNNVLKRRVKKTKAMPIKDEENK